MKKTINTLEKIKDQVTAMYSYTEGINMEMSKESLVSLLNNVSLEIEKVTNHISSEIENEKINLEYDVK